MYVLDWRFRASAGDLLSYFSRYARRLITMSMLPSQLHATQRCLYHATLNAAVHRRGFYAY